MFEDARYSRLTSIGFQGVFSMSSKIVSLSNKQVLISLAYVTEGSSAHLIVVVSVVSKSKSSTSSTQPEY